MTPRLRPGGPLQDYATFHGYAVDTGDVDPVYPVLRSLADAEGLADEQRIWLTLLHVAYYHLGSALEVFTAQPEPGVPPNWIIGAAIGMERRGHGLVWRLEKHFGDIADFAASNGGLRRWLTAGLSSQSDEAWRQLTDRVRKVWSNGRWAAYKTVEMLVEVNGFPATAPDMGHAFSSGPRRGLELLYEGLPAGNSAAAVRVLDEVSRELCQLLGTPSRPERLAEVETTLCDFGSLRAGRYYVGHDIDVMQGQLLARPSSLTGAAFRARAEVFDQGLLGEWGGWRGVRPQLKTLYRTDGQLDWGWAAERKEQPA